MRSVFVAVILTFVSLQSLAVESLDLNQVLQSYLPKLVINSHVVSVNGECALSLNQASNTIHLSLQKGARNKANFTSDVTVQAHNSLVEQQGKDKDQGIYSYAKFSDKGERLSILRGTYYYEPSYDPADSLVVNIQEQELSILRANGQVQVKVTERTSGSYSSVVCLF